jgi:hypothetical protein
VPLAKFELAINLKTVKAPGLEIYAPVKMRLCNFDHVAKIAAQSEFGCVLVSPRPGTPTDSPMELPSLDKPAVDPKRRISVLNADRHEISTVPVYSKPA